MREGRNSIWLKNIFSAILLIALVILTNASNVGSSYAFYVSDRNKIVDEYKFVIENLPSPEVHLVLVNTRSKASQLGIIQDNISLLVDLPRTFYSSDQIQKNISNNSPIEQLNDLVHATIMGAISSAFGSAILLTFKALFLI